MGDLDIGMIGLGVMGENLSLNLDDKGFSVGAWDAWPEPVERFRDKARREGARRVTGFSSLPELVASLRRPRRIILLVKAGEVVDRTLALLAPLLSPGDLVVDGGNEHFTNTERRAREMAERGLHFMGMGVSGGEEGARLGPSLMPGGERQGYDLVAPMLAKIAAQVDGPCVTYCGPGGAGHYVKMVHNGIEYGDMQLIAEAADLLRALGGLSHSELADVFDEWNRGELESYLVAITARIFRAHDPETGRDMVDVIVDSALQKGTGRWTVEDAAELGAPVPTIAAAVAARALSSDRGARDKAATLWAGPPPPSGAEERPRMVDDVRAALYAAKACSYAQGFHLLRKASRLRHWGIPLAELGRIWKGGCIIRARFLGRIQEAYERDPGLGNLLFDPGFRDELASRQEPWRRAIALAVAAGVPTPALSASLAWYDTLRAPRLPAALTQAQRDYFGAHTYERIDRPGSFHTDWSGG